MQCFVSDEKVPSVSMVKIFDRVTTDTNRPTSSASSGESEPLPSRNKAPYIKFGLVQFSPKRYWARNFRTLPASSSVLGGDITVNLIDENNKRSELSPQMGKDATYVLSVR